MDVKVLRVLVVAGEGHNPGRACVGFHLCRDVTYDVEEPPSRRLVFWHQCRQRSDVLLRNDDNMGFPTRVGVVERQNQIVVMNNLQLAGVWDRYFAVEIRSGSWRLL